MKCKKCGKKAGFLKTECDSCKNNRLEEYRQKEREKEIEEERRRQSILDGLEEIRQSVLQKIETFLESKEIIQEERNEYDVNFMKSEMPFFSTSGCGYFLEKTKTHYEGGSTGASFRVMKGLWIRQSAFKGSPIKHDVLTLVDFPGECIITNKHLYWKGSKKAFRIKLEKLVHLNAFGNGIELMRDTASARPEFIGYDEETMSPSNEDKMKIAFSFDLIKESFDLLMK